MPAIVQRVTRLRGAVLSALLLVSVVGVARPADHDTEAATSPGGRLGFYADAGLTGVPGMYASYLDGWRSGGGLGAGAVVHLGGHWSTGLSGRYSRHAFETRFDYDPASGLTRETSGGHASTMLGTVDLSGRFGGDGARFLLDLGVGASRLAIPETIVNVTDGVQRTVGHDSGLVESGLGGRLGIGMEFGPRGGLNPRLTGEVQAIGDALVTRVALGISLR